MEAVTMEVEKGSNITIGEGVIFLTTPQITFQ